MDEARLRMVLGCALAGEPPIRPVGGNVLRAGIRRRRRRRVLGAAGGATVATLIAVAIPGVIRPLGAPPDSQQSAGYFTVYVRSVGAGTVTPISAGASTPGQPITVGQGTGGIGVTPDGRTIYVADYGGMVTPVTTATNTPRKPIKVG
jgi:YVTN family beta-propeller protein